MREMPACAGMTIQPVLGILQQKLTKIIGYIDFSLHFVLFKMTLRS